MIHLGIIGTNWITHQFVEAALHTKKYELTAVYSRKLESAQEFGQRYHTDIEYATELATFFGIAHMDTVYIASPNSLHFEQARQAIHAGKNIIVEKPAFSTPEELDTIIQLANEKHVFFFEAARNIHEAGFKKVNAHLPVKDQILGANFTYMKYSSRYDQVLDGEEPNIFSPHFSGGALMDLGVYLVYASVAWFGMPEQVYYFNRKIRTGVDGLGTAILRYDLFDVVLQPGKINDSFASSEIYFDSGTLVLNGVNAIEHAEYHDRNKGTIEQLAIQATDNPMAEEAADFARIIENPKDNQLGLQYEEWVELARNVHHVLYELRKNGGITFDADDKEE
ncbi:MAG: Gfo/Idh/MocA family protein [Enterococcus sp.]